VKWVNGVPSGLRWTTLIDSLVNYLRSKIISEYVNRKWRATSLLEIRCAGDDDDFTCSSWFLGYLVFKTYELFSIPVHSSKNFISNDCTEFLKNLVLKEGKMVGYKARKVANLFFISPEKQLKPEGTYDEINYSVWDQCVREG